MTHLTRAITAALSVLFIPLALGAQPQPQPTQYMTLPIRGTIGHDALAAGVEDALTWARLRGIEHVLIHIDSAGGSLEETARITDLLQQHDALFTYSARVGAEATGAAAMIMLACDQIFFDEGAAAGAAVARADFEDVEDVEDMTVWSARLSALASAKGHSPVLAAAMSDPSRRVFVEYDDSGDIAAIHDQRPQGGSRVDQIDDAGALLTLTADQAVEVGLGRWWSDRAVFTAGWDERQTYGAAAMQRAHRDRLAELDRKRREAERLERDQQNVEAWVAQLPTLIQTAEDKDPWNYRDYRVDRETEQLTEESRLAWRRRTDDAIRAWRRVRAGIETIYEVMRRHSESDFPADLILHVRTEDAHAAEMILRLRSERGRVK